MAGKTVTVSVATIKLSSHSVVDNLSEEVSFLA